LNLALHLLGKHSATWTTPPAQNHSLIPTCGWWFPSEFIGQKWRYWLLPESVPVSTGIPPKSTWC
jgi:hypothetical protein